MQYPKLVESRTLANEVTLIEWNPRMDLLATIFSNGSVTCSRLLSLQKVWHKQSNGKVASVAWRPDGRVLVIGAYNEKTKENVCTLHDAENGKKIFTILKEQTITSVSWFQYVPSYEEKETDESIRSKILNSSTSNDNFSHQLAHEQTQLSILMIATEDFKISLYALGLFHLSDINLIDETSSRIVKTSMSNCLRYLTAVVRNQYGHHTTPLYYQSLRAPVLNYYTTLKVIKLDTLPRRSNEILKVAKMYAKITDELEYLEDTINAITTSWADVLAGLDSKLSSYCSRKSKKSSDGRGSYTLLSADELLQLLVIGVPSDNLEKFLADMSDKGLKKLNSAIEQTCLRVQNLIVKNAQKCCYHLHGDLNLLRGMSLWRERFEEVGLNDKFIVDAMRSVGSLVLKLTELQQVIDHSLKSTKSFFRWLISIACRTGEQTNSAVPSDINKTTQQDIQLITDFVLENFDYNSSQDDIDIMTISSGQNDSEVNVEDSWSRPTCSNFTLEQVGQYLKNEPLTRQKYSFTKPNSNFWIEFFRQRPYLTDERCLDEDGSSVLLFYPHNADTSLIQEHKKTCKSIDAAFKSVATNIKLVTDNGESSINLKEFNRNGPTERLRIKTDLKMSRHYTLFQTKSNQVLKQYLISQSLEDRQFKLISIEFQSKRSTNCPTTSKASVGTLYISDSDFYEGKETRLLLSFLLLDPSLGDTIIVQLDLNKLLESHDCAERSYKDMSKVFRTNDTVEKHSLHVVLKLDIYTEPACDRKNDLDMMVKKIKGTTGKDMYLSSGRGVIAFTSHENKRLHLYELESLASGAEIMDDEVEGEEKIDESLIDPELVS